MEEYLHNLIKPFEKFDYPIDKLELLFGRMMWETITFSIFVGDRKEIKKSLSSEICFPISKNTDFDLYRIKDKSTRRGATLMIFSDESFEKYQEKFKESGDKPIYLKLK
jgi:5,10-methylenetetrahydrofolate reductase